MRVSIMFKWLGYLKKLPELMAKIELILEFLPMIEELLELLKKKDDEED